MKYHWLIIKPTREEENWYEFLKGDKLSTDMFHRSKIQRADIKKNIALVNHYEKQVSALDSFLKHSFNELSKTHYNTIKDYSHLTDTMIGWFFPAFLRQP